MGNWNNGFLRSQLHEAAHGLGVGLQGVAVKLEEILTYIRGTESPGIKQRSVDRKGPHIGINGSCPVNGGDKRIRRQIRQKEFLAHLLVVVIVAVLHQRSNVVHTLSRGRGLRGGELLVDELEELVSLLVDVLLLVREAALALGADPLE